MDLPRGGRQVQVMKDGDPKDDVNRLRCDRKIVGGSDNVARAVAKAIRGETLSRKID